jgi:hypothetical protein
MTVIQGVREVYQIHPSMAEVNGRAAAQFVEQIPQAVVGHIPRPNFCNSIQAASVASFPCSSHDS